MIKLSSGLEFLKEHDLVFYELASALERAFASDAKTTLIKLRQHAETLTQDLAAGYTGLLDQSACSSKS